VDALKAQYRANTPTGDECKLASRLSSNWAILRDKGLRPAVQLLAANNFSEAQLVETQTIETTTKTVRAQGTALRSLVCATHARFPPYCPARWEAVVAPPVLH
jgi:methyl-accepting chemotaxis protein I, serine sensor receptor